MSTIGKLFGRSPFGRVQEHMAQVATCIAKMSEAIAALAEDRYSDLDQIAADVSHLEHQADQIKDDIRNRLLKRIFMPIDRAEVLEIVSLQDALADTAEDLCVVLTIKRISIPDDIRDDFGEFCNLNVKAFETVATIIDQLDELIESGFGGAEGELVRSLARQVAYTEHQADLVQIRLLKKLYAHDQDMTAGEFHLWMRLTRILGSISNLSENLADRVLKTLSLK